MERTTRSQRSGEKVLDWDDYKAHRLWYDDGTKYRRGMRAQWTTEDIEDLYDDGSDNEAYNYSIRELKGRFREFAPLMNRISSKLNKSIFEASDALSSIHGARDSENKLRESMKKIVKKCCNLVGLLGCATSSVQEDEEEEDAEAEAEDEEEEDAEDEAEGAEEEDDEDRAEEIEVEWRDEEEEYNDDDGPPPTQTTQLEKRKAPRKDWKSSSPFQRARPPQRKKTVVETRSKHKEDRTSKRSRSK
ncbi:hypothetical protein D1007_33259 [Hordeum vulgare]|nr:hypothetical protein D1007_33259 [Hordeum vulgare]